jgi:hypothetical protein
MGQANEQWISMFRRIPADLHDTLVLELRTGTELVLQGIIKLEPDFMIIRGRVSGTQDSGRVVMIPYGEIAYLAVTRILKDPEVEAIFGKGAPPAVTALPAAATDASATTPAGTQSDPAASKDEATSTPAETVNVPKKPDQMSKNMLLAKLRERLKETK